MSKEGYNPVEAAEVENRKAKYERGLEQAEAYGKFLDSFKKYVWNGLQTSFVKEDPKAKFFPKPKEVDLDTTTMKLRDFANTNIGHAIESAIRNSGFSEKITFVTKDINDMTPSEFLQKIDELKASLKKRDSVPEIKSDSEEEV